MKINTTSDALDNLNKKLGGADIEIEPSTNKVDALKKIYKTLGGTDNVSGLSTVFQVLEKITEVAEAGGGGGDSDFSTAEVTFVNSFSEEDSIVCRAPLVKEEEGEYWSDSEIIANYNQPNTYNIILYKGLAVCFIQSDFLDEDAELSGNAVAFDGSHIGITGNATITFVG